MFPVAIVVPWVGCLTIEAAAQTPSFDVTSVKRNTSGENRFSITQNGRTYTATNVPIIMIIREAFGLSFESFRLEGGPSWISSDRYDILATLPENVRPGERPAMLRALLVDRFKITVHNETKEGPIYALVLARPDGKLGPGLTRANVDCEAIATAARKGGPPQPGASDVCASGMGGGRITGKGRTMAQLAAMLPRAVQRRVVDKTGLQGGFDFELRYSDQDTTLRTDPATGGELPVIFTAIQEQLGLRLESARGPVEMVVIDRIERPSEN